MPAFRQRTWVALLAILLGTAGGAVAGYLLGRVITLQQAEARLEQLAARVIDEGQNATVESRKVLAAMNGSPYPMCSDAEVGYFRKLVFESVYLRAAGRMRQGHIECSTSFGSSTKQTEASYQPDIHQRDGTLMYRNLPLFGARGEPVVAIQLDDSFIVYGEFSIKPLVGTNTPITVTDLDAPTSKAGRLSGDVATTAGAFLVTNGQFRDGDTLYGTHCSPDGMVCAAAHVPVSHALTTNRIEVGGFVACGTLTGTLLGFVCAIIYRRKQGFEHQLLRAIRKDVLRVVYQPIVDLESGKIVEAEALARWTNDDNISISPDDFVKVAESRGFVGEITKLVVRHVLRDFGPILRERSDFRVNVNIAAADLADPGFLPMLDEALAKAGVQPGSIGIEITESYTARQQVAKETILRLRQRGHFVHIDDFGTGYSSLAYLHDLSVDAVKIDKAFTKAIGTDAVTVTILPQILTMAETLGLRVIVEGIETPQQALYFAKAKQAIFAQGWLFGRPVAPELFLSALKEKESKAAVDESLESVGAFASTVPAA
ncbi:MAG: EAL domain-containing protein [Terracidiphilus sp.]